MELKKRQVYDAVASQERKFILRDCKSRKSLPIMCIGNAGTGIGSSIKGFNRRGGKWLRNRHARYTTVAITNEHRTSQTCVFCFGQVIRPSKEGMKKKNNGASRCLNPDCPSFFFGRAIQGRDPQAAVAIALAGISTMILKRPFEPFNPRHFSVQS